MLALTKSSLGSPLQRAASRRLERIPKQKPLDPPEHWQDWLTTLFPNVFTAPFAQRHKEFWEHVESIKARESPAPFFAIWPRGGAKTTSAETAAVRLGAKEVRRFCLYIRGTQDKANESVSSIAALLESKSIEAYYPKLASRKLGKYGSSKGWRVDTLRTVSGFNAVGLGLDAAVRGIKIEEFRPDLIIFDDIDSKKDSPETIEKKIDTLTTSILPTGSTNVAIIGIQNLIHSNSIFSKIVDGTADFLYNRTISGPYKAVDGLAYEQKPEGGYKIVAGTPTWEGQSLEICEKQMNDWGLSAFLQEGQHDVEDPPGGMFDHLEYRHIHWADLPELIDIVVWVDPAVTSTDKSDSMGIQADGLGVDNTLYRLYSWEQVTSPLDALKRAILKALELGASKVGVETDQGGDTWETVYDAACQSLVQDPDYTDITDETTFPLFDEAKAGAGHGSKAHRASQMLADYERGEIVHVIGTHDVLEKALRRFPKTKPFDLVDASYWSWDDIKNNAVTVGMAGRRT